MLDRTDRAAAIDAPLRLTCKRVAASELSARKPHALRDVSVPQLLLVGVTDGHKRVLWRGREYRGGQDDLIVLRPGERYGIDNRPGARGYRADLLQLPSALVADFRHRHKAVYESALKHALHGAAHGAPSLRRDRHTGQAWRQLLDAACEPAPAPLLEQHAHTLLLCLTLAGAAACLQADREAPLNVRVRQLLREDPGRDWSLDEIARRLGLGASTLRRQLSAHGAGFREMLEDERLGLALAQLQGTRESIVRIAAAAGYASASRFAIRFRRRYGLSPSELRAAL
ncbi:helix-turn-helix transcriptional regulator [Lysobacter enzymogenes]|uniref:helix-turn-helix transcriptional regulator n=1 Tax=Lysobacter enzymogenes TaxID=69 RepID=UPI0019D033D8|nr:AraC family transcriptional regulator [Lysobacter enzymogenes]